MSRSQLPHSKALLVEGLDDQHSIAHLLRHHIAWPDSCKPTQISSCPFWVYPFGGVDKLDKSVLGVAWKEYGRSILGVVVDADTDPVTRYKSIIDMASQFVTGLPRTPVKGGLVHDTPDGKRFGVWLMPNNTTAGMLETFLKHCVHSQHQAIWNHAEAIINDAIGLQPDAKRPDREKALIHTFLAWHDPPGNPFGTAIRAKVFDAHTPLAAEFADWCIRLFGLGDTRLPP